MAPVTCQRCGDLLRSVAAQVEVRIEYRSASSLRRLRTWKVRTVCRMCADAEWSAHDFPGGRQSEQEPML